jgi:HlyD family secretion protein
MVAENSPNHAMDSWLPVTWWRKKHWTYIGGSVGVLGTTLAITIAVSATTERSVRIPRANVTVAKVTRGPFHDFVPLRGKVVPLNTVYLDALEGGRVERILAQAGDMVSAGQALVELNNTELELDVLEREGRLIESITQLQAYETQLEQNRIANQKALAQIDYDVIRLKRSLARRTALVARALEAVDVQDSIQDELNHVLGLQPMQQESNRKQEDLRLRQLPQIQSQLEKLQEDLKITHGKLANLIVRAPVAGRLTSMDLRPGQTRNRGERFAEITPDTGYKLSASVDEYYLGHVHAGQTAVMVANESTWKLEVARVYPQVKEGTFTVDLTFQARTPPGLLPGQTLQGKLSLDEDRAAILLPSGDFLQHTGGNWIFVLARDGRTARRRPIKIGRRNSELVEVVSDLAVGDRAITSGYTGLERTDRIDLED